MRSAARLTYAQAQASFDGNPHAEMTATVKKTLADVWAAYKSLTVARGKREGNARHLLATVIAEQRIELLGTQALDHRWRGHRG